MDQQATVTADPVDGERAALSAHLRGLLPTARLRRQPVLPDFPLWLIDPSGMDAPLPDREAAAVFAEPPYWCFCWGSGLALAQRFAARPELVRGRTVLDFGCGSGVVAIAAARAGAARVIACDLDPWALRATVLNARENGVSLELFDSLDELTEPVDLLLAADVLYDQDNRPLLQRFPRCAREVLLADSRVRDFAEPGYVPAGEERAVTLPDLGESEAVKTVRFYRHDAGTA